MIFKNSLKNIKLNIKLNNYCIKIKKYLVDIYSNILILIDFNFINLIKLYLTFFIQLLKEKNTI